MKDTIYIEILEDGTISTRTGEFNDTNHVSADKLLEEIEQTAGGKVTVTRIEPQETAEWKRTRQVLRGGRIIKTTH